MSAATTRVGNQRAAVLIMAGGTGGHIFPGLAVADALRARGVSVRWLGARGGMEASMVPGFGIDLAEVDIVGLRGKGLAGWLRMPLRLTRAVQQARAVLAATEPDCAISFGGYAAGPGGLAAWMKGTPLLVHEQNRIPGLTNRVLARLARTVLQAFPGTFAAKQSAVTVGNPVRKNVRALRHPDQRWSGRTGPCRVLVTGGSQGAAALNRAMPEWLAAVPQEDRPLVRHQAGRNRVESTASAYREAGVEADVTAFIDDMAEAYGWADLVVCRSGALTVSELAVAGLGAVLVPFPHAVDDHQTQNAKVLVDAGAAVLVPEPDLGSAATRESFAALVSNRDQLLAMARRARDVAQPESAERVADACCEWVTA